MHAWSIGDAVFGRFYDRSIDNYTAELIGHVIAVGKDGFTMHRLKPDHRGNVIERRPHYASSWPTREAAEAHIAAHPFSVEPVKR